MKKTRRIFFLLIAFVGLFALGTHIYVRASQSLTMTEGAQIRTVGERQGLRFTATASEAFGEGVEHGFFVAIGAHDFEDMKDAIVAGDATIGGNKLVKKVDESEDLSFSLVVYNIPARAYKQDITAIAYIKSGETYEFPQTSVTRNIAEVAVAAYADYAEGEVPAIIVDAATQVVNYNMNGGSYVGEKEFVITRYNGGATGPYIVLSDAASRFSQYWSVVYLKNTTNPNVFEIVTYTDCTAIYTGEYDYAIGTHDTCTDTSGRAAILSLMNASAVGKLISLSSIPTASGAVNVTAKVFAANEFNYAADSATISYVGTASPKLVAKSYYDFEGWYDAETAGNKVTTIEAGNSGAEIDLYALFTPIVYEIIYVLDGGNCSDAGRATSYTVESPIINLPLATTMSKEGFTFGGWYDNATFSGDSITSIPALSNGDKTFYAQWLADAILEIDDSDISAIDVSALNKLTADVIVDAGLANGNTYKIIATGIGAEYSALEVTGYSSLAAALTNATAGENIYVTAGSTFSTNLTVSKANITIFGPNYGTSGTDTRVSEATISASIDVTAGGLVIDGLQFTGSAKQIKVLENVAGFKFTNNYVTATGASTGGGRVGFIAWESGIDVTSYFEVTNNYFSYASSAGRNTIAIYGTATNTKISNNEFNVTGGSASWEAIRMALDGVKGTFECNNNIFTGITSNFMLMINFTAATTSADFKDNVVQGTSGNTSGLQFLNLPAGKTLNIIGNTFYKVGGNTFNFSGCASGSTINLKYNYYKNTYFKVTTVGSSTFDMVGNYYSVGIDAANALTIPAGDDIFTNEEDYLAAYQAYLGN